ncbi:MAG: OB-fold nucleic acid binding domain-containing protein, partial [Candidatus Micrarchaeota archaeon]|nr:OB-fold nucleic acid binding domain-containing protein [Candidatus Micrarchaeota archaeon]
MRPIGEILSDSEVGKEVEVRGWVHRERGSNKMKFILLRDSSGMVQCVFSRDNFETQWEEIDHLQVEASLTIRGTVKKDVRAPTGYEISVKSYQVVGKSENFPISKDQSIEFLADNRHLWLRSSKMTAVLKVRSTVIGAIHEYFRGEGFYEYQSPIFQAVQCEGGSELFSVNYFDKKDVFLAQTWQLYAEPAIFALEKIYTVAPSFRAEKSKTSRHLTEYWHAEMEVAWADFNMIQDYGEALLKHIVRRVLERNVYELRVLGRDLAKLRPTVEKPFVRMTYSDALTTLKEKCGMEVEWGKDLRTIEEEKLATLYDVPIICTRYPKKVKAFYMMEDPDDPRVVLGCDFLAPEGHGEIIGGSQ